MLKKSRFGKPVSAVLPMLVYAGIGLSPVSSYASMVDLPDVDNPAGDHGRPAHMPGNPGMGYGRPEHVPPINPPIDTPIDTPYMPGNPGMGYGRPEHVPPINPPIDTPAFYKGLVNTPAMMPASVPSHTLPGSGFGQAVVPVPAALWLFGSGLLGLIGIARRKKVA